MQYLRESVLKNWFLTLKYWMKVTKLWFEGYSFKYKHLMGEDEVDVVQIKPFNYTARKYKVSYNILYRPEKIASVQDKFYKLFQDFKEEDIDCILKSPLCAKTTIFSLGLVGLIDNVESLNKIIESTIEYAEKKDQEVNDLDLLLKIYHYFLVEKRKGISYFTLNLILDEMLFVDNRQIKSLRGVFTKNEDMNKVAPNYIYMIRTPSTSSRPSRLKAASAVVSIVCAVVGIIISSL